MQESEQWVVVDSDSVYDGGEGADGARHASRELAEQEARAMRAAGGRWRVEPWRDVSGFAHAAERASFQLTYRRAAALRRFHRGGMSGPEIDCAFDPDGTGFGGYSTDDWWAPDDPADEAGITADEWHGRFFALAMAEAAHEVMEWFKVDGHTVVNPHRADLAGPAYDLFADAARRMWAIAHERPVPERSEEDTLSLPDLAAIRRRLASIERMLNGNGMVVTADRIGSRQRKLLTVDDEHGSVVAELVWDEGAGEFLSHAAGDIAALLAERDALVAEVDRLRSGRETAI